MRDGVTQADNKFNKMMIKKLDIKKRPCIICTNLFSSPGPDVLVNERHNFMMEIKYDYRC
jgi:hypothetical protein